MPFNSIERARIFLGMNNGNDPIEVGDNLCIYTNFESALRLAHGIANQVEIPLEDGFLCPGQLSLIKAAKVICQDQRNLPQLLQRSSFLLGLAANDIDIQQDPNSNVILSYFYSAGEYSPVNRSILQNVNEGSSDDLIAVLSEISGINAGWDYSNLSALIHNFTDHKSNARHAYDDDANTGWWYQGAYLVENEASYDLYCASLNIGDTFGKAWDKNLENSDLRNPLLDQFIQSEVRQFLGFEGSRDLEAQVGYAMAPSNSVGRFFVSVGDFSSTFDATTQATLVSGTGQLSMTLSPGQYEPFDGGVFDEEYVGHRDMIKKLRKPVFSANDFSTFKLGGTLISVKSSWPKN